MNRNVCSSYFLVLTLAALSGCSSGPAANEAKKAAPAPDKIQGKVQVNAGETSAADAALNAGGGQSVYLWEGTKRYRLFFRTPVEVNPGKQYIAEGVYAQKVIDELGDPDQGKNGYPLQSSCERVVSTAWGSGQAFDVTDGQATVLRARVKRYPARPVFLVTKLTPVEGDAAAKAADDDNLPEVAVPAEKQRALLAEGPTTLAAPLWEPAGGTAKCKVIIGKDGKVSELETGAQLCESVPWSQFRYQPPVQGGKPVKVKTEVEVKFEPRK
jgi:hypothetical protein